MRPDVDRLWVEDPDCLAGFGVGLVEDLPGGFGVRVVYTGRSAGESVESDLVADMLAVVTGTIRLHERTVNGQPGLVAQDDGVTVTVFAFEFAGDRIKHIWVMRNPDKLGPWTAT